MFSINENQEITVRHGVHHDNPSTIVSKMLKADLPDSNKMIKYMFKPQIDAMNRRIQCFNHEKKILKELDLFVLDTSLQEFPSCQNEFTIEKKWKIYNEVKKLPQFYLFIFNSLNCHFSLFVFFLLANNWLKNSFSHDVR